MNRLAPNYGVPLIALAAVLALAACAPKVTVSHNFDTDVDFSTIQSFHWLGIRNTTGLPAFDVKRVQSALRAELVNKGLRELTNADVLVAAYLGVNPKQETAWEYSHGLYWTERQTTVTKGLLIVDVVDAKTRNLIWRAEANGARQPDASPEERERNMARVAKKVFDGLPVTGK